MTFSTSKFNKKWAVAALVASACGVTAFAQNATPGTPSEGHGGMHHPMGKMNADGQGKGSMQARAEKRLAELKSKLKITAAQEGAWNTFTTAMKPPADGAIGSKGAMGMRHDPAQHAEMQKLTTPERIEKMRAMRQGRQTLMNAEMDKRADASKVFYAALSSEQKAVFDAVGMQGGHDGRGHGEKGERRGEHRGFGRMGQAN